MAMLLDLRTVPCINVGKGVRVEAVRLLEEAYVKFGLNCALYKEATSKATSGNQATNIYGSASHPKTMPLQRSRQDKS